MSSKGKLYSAVLGFLFFSILVLVRPTSTSVCRNEQGQEVAWFMAIRLPNSRTYWVFEDKSTRFRNLPDEKLLATLFEGIDLRSDSVKLWNDEPATQKSNQQFNAGFMTAHDKGVLYRNNKDRRGFYLLHSVPLFPSHNGVSLNPETPTISQYGQSMVCISLNKDSQYDVLNRHLDGQRSQVYFDNFPQLNKRPARTTEQKMDDYLEGTPFRILTKTVINLSNPYEDFLRQATGSDWLVESWGRPYKQDTCSSDAKIINNRKICFGTTCFPSTSDHSKWAVSTNISGLVCISGLNHMDSQSKRGGTFVCFNNGPLYLQLRTIASDYTICPASIKRKLL
jgi:deoxyribonuclease-2